MTNLTILSKSIRQLDNLYSLNDLHKTSGADKKHQPANFIRLEQTQALIEEINRSSDMRNAFKTKQGGKDQGTYVSKELVYAYAMWISPKFNLAVIRAFDTMQTIQQPEFKQIDIDKQHQKNYQLINDMIAHMELPNRPVVVPYVELANLVLSSRHIQKSTLNLLKSCNGIDNAINNLKTTSGKSFGDFE